MSRAKVILDGEVMLDGDLNHWQEPAPEFVMQLISETQPSPTLKSVAVVLVEAILREQPITITINSHNSGFTMHVDYTCSPAAQLSL